MATVTKTLENTDFSDYDGPVRRSRRRNVPVAVDDSEPVRALSVSRLSVKTEANRGNIATQEKRNLRNASGAGWEIVEYASGDGVSGFDREKPWPGFLRALDLIRAGVVNAIVCVALDRITRDIGDVKTLCDVCEEFGVRRIMVGGAVYDPVTQRMTLNILGAVADEESRIKRDRAIRKHEQMAQAGKPHNGRRPYGYEKGGMEIRDSEAEVIRECMARALSGAPIAALARDLNLREIPSARGGRWTASSLRQILWSWRIAGIRSLDDVPVAVGQWPAIVSRADLEAFRSGLGRSGNGHKSQTRRGRPRALLSGLVKCECHGYLAVKHGPHYYVRSVKGADDCSIWINRTELEDWVSEDFVITVRDRRYLSDSEKAKAKELAVIEKALAAVRSRRDRLQDSYASGRIELEDFEPTAARLRTEERELVGKASEVRLAPSTSGLAAVVEDWERLTDSERRKALDVLVEEVIVRPHPFRDFRPERDVSIRYRF